MHAQTKIEIPNTLKLVLNYLRLNNNIGQFKMDNKISTW